MKGKVTIARFGGLWGTRVFGGVLPSLGGLCSRLLVVFILSFLHSSIFLLTGCSAEQAVEPEPVEKPAGTNDDEQSASTAAIAFAAGLPEQQAVTRGVTRAETPLEDYATSFKVWGYKNMSYDEVNGIYGDLQTVFPGYYVNWTANTAATTTTNTHDWEYILTSYPDQSIKYWDFSAKAYRFFAVTSYEGEDAGEPYATNKTYEADGTYGASYPTKEFTMLANCSDDDGDATPEEDEVIAANMAATPYFSRLWFSTNELPTYSDKQYGKPVTLQFVKPYSKVRFMFTYSYAPEGIKLREKVFKPSDGSGIVRKGTFTVIYPLTGTATNEMFTVTPDPSHTGELTAFTQEYIIDGGPEREKWYTVLPNNTQGSYTLYVKISGEDKTAVVPETYMTWLPGYAYTYIFKITEEGGVKIDMVQSAVIEWDRHEGEHTVYNW